VIYCESGEKKEVIWQFWHIELSLEQTNKHNQDNNTKKSFFWVETLRNHYHPRKTQSYEMHKNHTSTSFQFQVKKDQ
jgi:hypothetical protein